MCCHDSTLQNSQIKKPLDSKTANSSNGADCKSEPTSLSCTKDESGPFVWGKILGSGASGTVHKCVDIRNGMEVACKVIRKRNSPIGAPTPFVEVAALIALRDYPGIIQLEDFYEGKKNIVLTMELCRGGDLLDRINLRGPYSEFDAAKVFATLSEIIRNCHAKKIMHRDLKPENVLLKSMESDTDIRLADFGQAAFFEEGVPLTDTAGTILYHSPEVINGKYGPESDIWSLGVILYVLLSGEQPFQRATLNLTLESIAKGNFNVEKGKWRKISPLAIDLVTRILTVDVKKRITLSEILRHPWILRNSVRKRSFSDLTSEMSSSYVHELYSSPLSNRFLKQYVFQTQFVGEEQILDLHRQFPSFHLPSPFGMREDFSFSRQPFFGSENHRYPLLFLNTEPEPRSELGKGLETDLKNSMEPVFPLATECIQESKKRLKCASIG